MTPHEWLPDANSFISIFLPASSKVRSDNSINMDWPSSSWLHARIEGERMIANLSQFLKNLLKKESYHAVIPTSDPRFFSHKGLSEAAKEPIFTSNWSERRVAFICGLGTFGLSKGLITEKGVAGRYTSLITNLSLLKDKREYEDLYNIAPCAVLALAIAPQRLLALKVARSHEMFFLLK